MLASTPCKVDCDSTVSELAGDAKGRCTRSALVVLAIATVLVGWCPARCVASDEAIAIDVPSAVTDPQLVPFNIRLRRAMGAGGTLSVYVGRNLAYGVSPGRGVEVDFVSGRLRLVEAGGRVTARYPDGSSESRAIHIDLPYAATIPEHGHAPLSTQSKMVSGTFKVLFKHKMSQDQYINRIQIDTSTGPIEVEITPFAAEDPYLALRGNFDSAKVSRVAFATPDRLAEGPGQLQHTGITSAPRHPRSVAQKSAASHEQIILVQQSLASLGYRPGPVDGVIGQHTRDAISRFQRNAGLPVTATVTTSLIKALKEQVAANRGQSNSKGGSDSTLTNDEFSDLDEF